MKTKTYIIIIAGIILSGCAMNILIGSKHNSLNADVSLDEDIEYLRSSDSIKINKKNKN